VPLASPISRDVLLMSGFAGFWTRLTPGPRQAPHPPLLLRLFGVHGPSRLQLSARRAAALAMVAYLIGGGLIQCSCATTSVHAEPGGCKTSQVSANLPASIR
jgi:hypothetical protein